MQKPAITMPDRRSMRNMEAAFCEDQPVEHTVYQVAHRTRQYQCAADDRAIAVLFLHKFLQEEKAEDHCAKAKKGEHKLAYVGLSELHAECHTFIFYEMQAKPMAKYINFLAVVIMGFDVELKSLIEEYDQEHDYNGMTILHCIYFAAPKIANDSL